MKIALIKKMYLNFGVTKLVMRIVVNFIKYGFLQSLLYRYNWLHF